MSLLSMKTTHCQRCGCPSETTYCSTCQPPEAPVNVSWCKVKIFTSDGNRVMCNGALHHEEGTAERARQVSAHLARKYADNNLFFHRHGLR